MIFLNIYSITLKLKTSSEGFCMIRVVMNIEWYNQQQISNTRRISMNLLLLFFNILKVKKCTGDRYIGT